MGHSHMALFLLDKNVGVWLLRHDKHMFNLIRHFSVIFQSGYTTLYPHQKCMTVPVIIYYHFVNVSHSKGMWSYLLVVWIALLLMTSDVEHLLMCLLTIHIPSFVKSLITSFAPFYLVVYLTIELFSVYFVCKIFISMFHNHFSKSDACVFFLLTMYFEERYFFILKSHFPEFLFTPFVSPLGNLCPT